MPASRDWGEGELARGHLNQEPVCRVQGPQRKLALPWMSRHPLQQVERIESSNIYLVLLSPLDVILNPDLKLLGFQSKTAGLIFSELAMGKATDPRF